MAEIPMRYVYQTDFGDFELSRRVWEKLDALPKIKVVNPFTEEVSYMDVIDPNIPLVARYERLVTRHMKRRWLAGEA